MLIASQAHNKSLTESIMRTYTHNLIAEHGTLVGLGFLTHRGYATTTVTKAKGGKGKATWVKRAINIALFFAAPFIGLVYLLAFPVIGLALLLWIGFKAVKENKKARPIALAIAAPVIALAFVTVGPFVGLGALAWAGGRALLAG